MGVISAALEDRLMTEKEAAERYGISVRTFQAWRVKGSGPSYCKIGRSVRYRQSDLNDFIKKCVTGSTSEHGVSQ